jgi:arsenate reductase (thioredoxin)
MSTVLFVCLHNAGRSQMSRALFDQAAGGHHHALSAGSVDWDVRGPKGRPVEEVRAIRDEIARRVTELVAEVAEL